MRRLIGDAEGCGMREAIEQFREAMRAAGLEPPDAIKPDKLHRVPGIGKRNGNTADWCKLFADGLGGVFGDWAAGFSETWQAKRDKPLTQAERKAFTQQCEQEKRARQAEQEREHAAAREYAECIWREAKPENGEHRYLRDKGVNPHEVRRDGQRLVIPLRDTEGRLHSLQYINPNGNKRYLKGGRVFGCYHAIGKPNGVLCIAEGIATAASIHEATEHAVVVAFDAGNLKPVAQALHAKYPDLRLVLCADNDVSGSERNTGIEEATKAAQGVGGLIAIPEMDGEKCDFNDLLKACGAEAVQARISNAEPPTVDQVHPQSDGAIKDAEDAVETLARLAALSPIEYDRCRQAEAERLNVRVGTLDDEVKGLRPHSNTDTEAGSSVLFDEPEPWAEPVDGVALLDALADTFSHYIVLPAGAADALALWVAHTHVYSAFEYTPRLNVTGPVKQCGKTLLLDVLQTIVAKGLRTENLSTAVTFRLIEAQAPTLLIDEYDSFLKDNEELRGALNAGQKRGGLFLRCVGDNHEVRAFKVFAPVGLAGIGALPGTLADRSIIISMQRTKPGEMRQRFDSRKTACEQELKRKLMRWGQDNRQRIEASDPEMPGLYNRRADTWRPLFAIAETVGSNWLERVKIAVTALTDKSDDSESAGVLLLADIRQIFNRKPNHKWLPSAEINDELIKREDSPWPEWRNGKPITQAGIARLLKPFGIRPKQHCYEDGRAGISSYERAKFADAFARYLVSDEPATPDKPAYQSSTPLQPVVQSHSAEFQSSTACGAVELTKTREPLPHKACRGVELRKPDNGTRVWTKPAFKIIPNSPEDIPWHTLYPPNRTTIDGGPWSMRL